jgi:hypothetical protein
MVYYQNRIKGNIEPEWFGVIFKEKLWNLMKNYKS